MRTTTLLGLCLGLATAACVGMVTGEPVGGTGGSGSNGSGSNGSGSNGSGSDGSGSNPVPAIAATIDKGTVTSELYTTEMLTVTVTGTMGFTGAVTLTPSVVDAQSQPVTGWTVTPNPATLTFTADGSQTSIISVKIPSDSAALAATVKIDAAGGALTASTSSAFTLTKQLHLAFDVGTGTGVPHAHNPSIPMNMTVHDGTKIIWTNNDTIGHEVHGSNGIQHEGGTLQPGSTYEVTMTLASGDGQWYCHTHNENAGSRQIQVVQ